MDSNSQLDLSEKTDGVQTPPPSYKKVMNGE